MGGSADERRDHFDDEVRRVIEARERERASGEDVYYEMPFGLGRLGGRGRRIAGVIFTGVILVSVVVGFWWHDGHMQEQNAKTNGYFRAIIYVLTLPEEERRKLKLDMPEELRRWHRTNMDEDTR